MKYICKSADHNCADCTHSKPHNHMDRHRFLFGAGGMNECWSNKNGYRYEPTACRCTRLTRKDILKYCL